MQFKNKIQLKLYKTLAEIRAFIKKYITNES